MHQGRLRYLGALAFAASAWTVGATAARAADIVTLLSTPDHAQTFVDELLVGSPTYLAQPATPADVDRATRALSALKELGIGTVYNLEVGAGGAADAGAVGRALHDFGGMANTVWLAFGGKSEALCAAMASHPKLAFVWLAGEDGRAIDPLKEPSCKAGNILRVAALASSGAELSAGSSFGPTVRIAAAGGGLATVGAGGVAADAPAQLAAAARVAAALSTFGLCGCYDDGEDEITNFLREQTHVVRSLAGAVEGERVLND
jgi:hypothetical protein